MDSDTERALPKTLSPDNRHDTGNSQEDTQVHSARTSSDSSHVIVYPGTDNRNYEDSPDIDRKGETSRLTGSYKREGENGESKSKSTSAQRVLANKQKPKHGIGVLIAAGICLFSLAYFVMFAATAGTRYSHTRKVNVILMISDGYGPAAATLAREFVQWNRENVAGSLESRWGFPEGFTDTGGINNGGFGHLPLDPLLVGTSRTRSSDSLVTDSAAGATAFSCGIKTYNGGVAVEPVNQLPCGTVLEAAKHRGYLTGLVATSEHQRITHATPAAFYSHVVDRDSEADIAEFLVGKGPLGHVVDLAFGGGERFFLPSDSPQSSRPDSQDLMAVAENNGYTLLRNGSAFDAFWGSGEGKTSVPVLGIFNNDHMNYEIDRMNLTAEHSEPTLRNMSLAALQTLSRAAHKQNAHGFFLMIEGSKIDMAEHVGDPVGTLYDVLAYQETVRMVKAWVDEANRSGWPTVMISTSDHETGGLALGRQLTSAYPEYLWHPSVLQNATHSAEYLASYLDNLDSSTTSETSTGGISRDLVRQVIFRQGLGLSDGTEREIDDLVSGTGVRRYKIADIISRRCQIGWSTHGHSGVDVNVYAYPFDKAAGEETMGDVKLLGNLENTDISKFIVETMSINLSPVTADLNRSVFSSLAFLTSRVTQQKGVTQKLEIVAQYN